MRHKRIVGASFLRDKLISLSGSRSFTDRSALGDNERGIIATIQQSGGPITYENLQDVTVLDDYALIHGINQLKARGMLRFTSQAPVQAL